MIKGGNGGERDAGKHKAPTQYQTTPCPYRYGYHPITVFGCNNSSGYPAVAADTRSSSLLAILVLGGKRSSKSLMSLICLFSQPLRSERSTIRRASFALAM